MSTATAVASTDARLAELAQRLAEQDERLRQLDASIRALARFPTESADAAETKPLVIASARTPAIIPWPVREAPAAPTPAAGAELDLLRAAVSHSGQAIVGLDAAGAVRLWNGAAEDIFGWPADSVLGSSPPFLPEDRLDEHAEFIRTARLVGRVAAVPTIRRRRNGELVAVRVSATPARGGGAVFVFRELSDRPSEPQPVPLAPDPATERFAALGRVVAGVAHDFNNLLSVVRCHGELLAEQLPAGGPQRESAEAIVASADAATSVSRQLLGVARPDPDGPPRADLTDVLHRLGRLIRTIVGGTVSVVSTLAPGLRPVQVPSADLTQVVLNLATNARDAMPDGGTLTIRTTLQTAGPERPGWPVDIPPGEYVVLTVTDTGVGMGEATRQHALDPLFTTKANGCGLGLMAVNEIVTRVGGHIEIESDPGWGTQVRVYFP